MKGGKNFYLHSPFVFHTSSFSGGLTPLGAKSLQKVGGIAVLTYLTFISCVRVLFSPPECDD